MGFISNIGVLNERIFPVSGLQSYWRMETGTTVVDYGPNAYNGISSNVTWVAGKNGNGGSYNTTTSKVELADNTKYDYERTQAFSLSCWLKRLHTGGAAPFIYSKSVASGAYNGHSAFINSSNFIIPSCVNNGAGNANALIKDGTIALSATTVWYHIVLTYDGSSAASGYLIYVNAVEGSTTYADTLSATIKNTATFQIGNRNTALAADAIIDEVGWWNRVLSLQEVKDIYNLGTGIYY